MRAVNLPSSKSLRPPNLNHPYAAYHCDDPEVSRTFETVLAPERKRRRNVLIGTIRKAARLQMGDWTLNNRQVDRRLEIVLGSEWKTQCLLIPWTVLGQLFAISAEERIAHRLWMVFPCDQTWEQFSADRRRRRAVRERAYRQERERRRRDRGIRPRDEYLASHSTSQNKLEPWRELGISRSTYFAWKAAGKIGLGRDNRNLT